MRTRKGKFMQGIKSVTKDISIEKAQDVPKILTTFLKSY